MPDSREKWQHPICEGKAVARDILDPKLSSLAYLRLTYQGLAFSWSKLLKLMFHLLLLKHGPWH